MKNIKVEFLIVSVLIFASCSFSKKPPLPNEISLNKLRENFITPPDSCRPGVYWYFMDGNLSREGITGDLESMKAAGIGQVIFLEVNVGVPRGKVDFLSEDWKDLFKHAVKECERLGIELTLGSGPGWAGSGGPWVKAEQSMRHLVASARQIKGPVMFDEILAKPDPRTPYFGEGALTDSLKKEWKDYYEDVCVLAFPTSNKVGMIKDVDEKALVYRAPYTSAKNVKPYLPALATYSENSGEGIPRDSIVNLTQNLGADGHLIWKIPTGNWTIMRFGARNNGAVTRPAPFPGLGFEVDKFDTAHFNTHFEHYIGKLLDKVGNRSASTSGGWTMIHIDSWEMGAQNWSDNFRNEFTKRRGYDPLNFFPVYMGRIVDNREVSERFLWDIRQTAMELVLENHAQHFKILGRRNGFRLSIEPYDMNPTADLDLGAVADVPMCEFWSKGLGFNSSFSCLEATSIAHILGKPVVAAEAFTADFDEKWTRYPANMKNQGDWAFGLGINKFVYHTFAHKPWNGKYLPGMTMGPYGVHWDRGQTWWSMIPEYHKYITRCQYVLSQGKPVADILYLTPEGAPHVFRPPLSALTGDSVLPDKRRYNFDGCSPLMLMQYADVKNNRIVFPGGASYSVLVLSNFNTMTPELIKKIDELLEKGAIVIGMPPLKSPSLAGFPGCDEEVKNIATKIWGTNNLPDKEKEIRYGGGKLYWGGAYTKTDENEIFPNYEGTSRLLGELGIIADFESSREIRYNHRVVDEKDIYFVSNRTDSVVNAICKFRTKNRRPELWNPVSGEIRRLSQYEIQGNRILIPLKFDKSQSFFIVFDSDYNEKLDNLPSLNFPGLKKTMTLQGNWNVMFDPRWGGPEHIEFDRLIDWSTSLDDGVRYYSGIATYRKKFNLTTKLETVKRIYLDLGEVKNIARVKVNDKDLGVIWTSPWRVEVTGLLKEGENKLEIEVANLWTNRMIGDERYPYDGVENGTWPSWLVEGKTRTSGRFTFVPLRFYSKDSSLQPSGLLGPVTLMIE